MVLRHLNAPKPVPLDFGPIRTELGIPGDFPPDVLAAATETVVAGGTHGVGDRIDATDIELVTIDPPGSMDLDQAVAIEAVGTGWRVHYAIADVAAWVEPGGPIDVEAHRRTQTFYTPDTRVPLHPPALGESAASLLPDGPRPAALWTIEVDAEGETTAIDVRRAMVRSRARLDYAGVQAQLDAGTAPPVLQEFPALGAALTAAARRRGAIELGLPEQDVVKTVDGSWTVSLRADLPVEGWNAQVSLLTGRSAATLMIEGGIGLLRTLPSPDPATFPRLQRAAHGLGIAWADGQHPGEVLASLDTANPRHAAFADLAAELLRGAGYTAFQGDPPADPGHAGVGAPYAHVTAPLRRLVDRYATEICLALVRKDPVPDWVLAAVDTVSAEMADGDRLAHQLDRAVLDATEAFVLKDKVGHVFAASVIETGDRFGTVVLEDPPVRARCDTRQLPLGGDVHVRCIEADVTTRQVRFERVS